MSIKNRKYLKNNINIFTQNFQTTKTKFKQSIFFLKIKILFKNQLNNFRNLCIIVFNNIHLR